MPETRRRLSPELKLAIMQRLKLGARPADVEREFHVCFNTVAKLRRLIGDVPAPLGSGRKRKLSQKVLELAEQRLRNGERLNVVAADCGVHVHTLHNCMKFRKRGKRR